MGTKTVDPVEEGMLADIRAHPDRDDLRLVYADYMEDTNHPLRAEFIRLQIQLWQAGIRAVPQNPMGEIMHDGTQVDPLVARCRELFMDHTWEAVGENGLGNLGHSQTEVGKPGSCWFDGYHVCKADIGGYRCEIRYGQNSSPHIAFCWQRGFVDAVLLRQGDVFDHMVRIMVQLPVTVVWLSDVLPIRNQPVGRMVPLWPGSMIYIPVEECWYEEGTGTRTIGEVQHQQLDPRLYHHLGRSRIGGGSWQGSMTRRRYYKTGADAMRDLSYACRLGL
jgi:uncharacterized protein (TIGR02996 family)